LTKNSGRPPDGVGGTLTEEERESPEVEENKETKEKTEVATKEAMLRAPSGQL
jgi:hypothetical protein